MDLDLGEDQAMLRDAVARYLGDAYPFDTRRTRLREGKGSDPALWRALATTLGVLGAAFPERVGGLGGGAVERMIVAEALGRALVAEPYLETVAIAGTALAGIGGDRADALLGGIADGSTLVVPAFFEAASRYDPAAIETRATSGPNGWTLDGTKAVVVAAPRADWLLVSANTPLGISLFLVAADAPALRAYRLIDERPAADIAFAATPAELVGTDGAALPIIERAMAAGIAALCAEAVGVMRRLLDDTVAYTKERRQFGQTLSSFQALQHRMVDMLIAVEQAQSASYLATLSLDADPVTRERALAAAKATIGDAIRFVGQNAVQLHGGMGMTEELPVGHYFKRATVIEQQFGPPDHHVANYAVLMEQAA